MHKIATYLLDETAKLVKEESQEAREIKQELVYLNNKMNTASSDNTAPTASPPDPGPGSSMILTNPMPEPTTRPPKRTWADFIQATGFKMTLNIQTDQDQSEDEQFGPDYMGDDPLEWLDL